MSFAAKASKMCIRDRLWRCDTLYHPDMDEQTRHRLLAGWGRAVSRSLGWSKPE